MPRSPLTETIKRVEGMIAHVRENLDEGEYDLFLDLILPEPEPVKATTRRSSKKSSRGASKSSRASGMAAAIKNNLQRREPTVGGFADDADMLHCSDCGAGSDDNVHHKRSDENYHPFVSTAQPARGKLSTNGGAGSEADLGGERLDAIRAASGE